MSYTEQQPRLSAQIQQTRFCRDCTFAKPSARIRAMAPFGSDQWRYAKCQHMAAMCDNEDDIDRTTSIAVTGSHNGPSKAETSDGQQFCSVMRRMEWLCGPEGQYFSPRIKPLAPPITIWTTPLGAVIFPLITSFSIGNVIIGFLVGLMIGAIVTTLRDPDS